MSKNKKFYISTAIAYSSAVPHIGNVYEAILADSIARFKRLDGYNVYFQTGTDEHGQKIEEKAKLNEITPQVYVDQISNEIKRIYDSMNVSYDKFVRTTDEFHVESVQAIVSKLFEQGDIYLGKYEGWYSIADEAYISENDIVDGKGPSGDIPVWTSEEVYFFKLSKYQDRLIKHIKDYPEFIMPESRKNEMLQNFLSDKLPDLSISRTSFKWGIPFPFDKKHVTYVWIDALSNYITGLGYNPNHPESDMMKEYWPADIHLIGKDILRFHTIYWPMLLMALELPLPKTIFGHPWVLFDKAKMSKSTGNVVYIDDLLKHFPVDVIRYYVLHEIPYSQDGNLTNELLIERNNSDLANTIGNLVNRTIGMVNKYRDGKFKKVILDEPFEYSLKDKSLEMLPNMRKHMENYHVADALEEILILARHANKYIDVSKPWELFKDLEKPEILDHVLYSLLETIRFIAIGLQAYLPATSAEIFDLLGIEDKSFESLKEFGHYKEQELKQAKVLFERYDMNKKIEEILEGTYDKD
ncbi:methionine--tRNA ligase [Haploplasma axanthum]|uniref:Methionine--tRNA ligase n=1 Tax=Haploplasma axanthum TaxID=29552 RepID=A0A449BCJ6_HAPAX|nr:methionine--tRNA ligase [Haploplasma axanthum]VEU80163.1 Methionine--tRNA ligase [Haploplasma axanthum]